MYLDKKAMQACRMYGGGKPLMKYMYDETMMLEMMTTTTRRPLDPPSIVMPLEDTVMLPNMSLVYCGKGEDSLMCPRGYGCVENEAYQIAVCCKGIELCM